MKFDRLKLNGFKSFVDTGDFVINPGITGIVGPNGCGKSNLVEALRWVMGESSFKNMRASEMNDVIFSGSKQRTARNVAEVTVFLDNKDRTAPNQFNEEDVLEISRRIERSKGSTYRVNGRSVRAKDVQMLFADSSTGARSPALVGQGQIGALISAKPMQRRAFLEEAAGISGLYSRRQEAQSKLRAAEQNLARSDDLIEHIESQLSQLRRQAKSAQKYKRLTQEIRQLEARLYLTRWQEIVANKKAAESELLAVHEKVKSAQLVQANAAKNDAIAQAKLPKLRELEIESNAKLQRLMTEERRLEDEFERLGERKDILDAQIKQALSDSELEMHRNTELVKQIDVLKDELSSLEQEITAHESVNLEYKQDVAKLTSALEHAQGQYQDRLTAHLTQQSQLEAAKASLDQHRMRKSQIQGLIQEQSEKLQALSDQADNSTQFMSDQNLLVEFETKLERINTKINDLSEQCAQLKNQEKEVQAAREEKQNLLTKIEAQAETLAGILAGGAQENDTAISENITIQDGYEIALGACLGEALEAGKNCDDPAFWREIESLDDMPLPDNATSLLPLVQVPDVLKRRLAQIGLVETIADGERLQAQLRPGQYLVTKSGDIWRWDGFCRKSDAPTPAAQRLAYQNQYTQMQKEIKRHKTQLDEIVQAHIEIETKVAASSDTLNSAEAEQKRLINSIDQTKKAIYQYQQQEELNQLRLGALQDRLSELQRDFDEAERQATLAQETLAPLKQASANDNGVGHAKDVADQAQTDLNRARELEQAQIHKASFALSQFKDKQQMRESLLQQVAQTEQRIIDLKSRTDDATDGLKALEEKPNQIKKEQSKLIALIEHARVEKVQAGEARTLADDEALEMRQLATHAMSSLSEATTERARIEERALSYEHAEDVIMQQISEAMNCSIKQLFEMSGCKDDTPNWSQNEIETELGRAKNTRDQMGAVNLRADIELEETENQFGSLQQDRQELIEAIAKLDEGIHLLNREGRSRLMKAFDAVNGHFGQLFSKLFGGGEAELQFIESEDPLEAGLEIIARPPGKKPQSMTLLSGGEQALTALSLVFAVFLTNPAPICVLDEVDAPLDDANVEHYCNLLDEMKRLTETRFIAITHNPLTMARMDRLFGVTMAEKGVSQLVSVDLEAADKFRDVAS